MLEMPSTRHFYGRKVDRKIGSNRALEIGVTSSAPHQLSTEAGCEALPSGVRRRRDQRARPWVGLMFPIWAGKQLFRGRLPFVNLFTKQVFVRRFDQER